MSDFSEAKVGDRVWSIVDGWGEVESVDLGYNHGPIVVKFETIESRHRFQLNGIFCSEDLFPTLFWDEIKFEIPERPKKVKKVLEKWANVYPGGNSATYSSKEVADHYKSIKRIACVKLTGEYEVEE